MKKLLLSTLFNLIILSSLAQESIKKQAYLYFSSNGSGIGGKLESIPEEGKIQFSLGADVQKIVQKDKILMAFNNVGNFLHTAQLSDDIATANKQIEDFNSQVSNSNDYDIIFKAVPFEIIPCKISYSKDVVNYKLPNNSTGSLNKNNVLAIIFRDGNHELSKDIIEVAPILAENKELFETRRQNKNINKSSTIEKLNSPKVEVVKYNSTDEQKRDSQNRNEDKSLSSANLKILTNDEKQDYQEKSIDRVQDFKNYLNVIGDKKRSTGEKNEAIKNALRLFISGSTIEVTSKNRPGSRRIPVETYLRNLSNLNYSSVSIEYVNLKFVSEFTQSTDGNYYGLVSGEQTFMGFGSNGKPAYSDVVNKSYKVKLESYEKFVNGEEKLNWKILLGDISVSQ